MVTIFSSLPLTFFLKSANQIFPDFTDRIGVLMQLQLIRNATLRISYAGRQVLTDPFLAGKHTLQSFAGISPNPLVDLPSTPQEVIAGIEMVIISHLHSDHFDPVAQELLPKDIPLFCQPGDETQLSEKGFEVVTVVEQAVDWQGITLTRTPGRHGTAAWAERMGNVSGFILQAKDEPVVYWAGDTIWYDPVEQIIVDTQPDIIITHSSGAKFGDSDPIVMDDKQTIAVCQAAPEAIVIAIHMETLDHGTVSRVDLRALAEAEGINPAQLLIPEDGENLTF
jgi:L-ascorbate metabolism protein UlaG (beta-lactamase superfamily)